MPSRPRRSRPATLVAVVWLCVLALVAGCSEGPSGSPPPEPDAEASGSPTAPPPSPSEALGLGTGWGPTRAELDRAAVEVSRLPLPDLAGQVILARYAGTAAPTALVRRLHLGGVVAFADNVTSPEQLRRATTTLRRDVRRAWPLAVAVDQEGGLVQRIAGSATDLPALMAAGAADRPALTRRLHRAAGAELRGLGVDLDLAPVADVTVGPVDPVIGSRSVGSDPAMVATHALAAAEGLREAGVVPVVKHFPGHGSLDTDSHLALPVQRRGVRALSRSDLVPFREAVRAGLPAVMTGHIAVREVDPGVPASLSRPVTTGLLRERLGFEGLVVSDALEMAAVTGPSPAVRVLRAGGDVVLMPRDPASARADIVRAVRAGRLDRTRLEQAATRLVALLRHQEAARGGRRARPGSAAEASRTMSREALTLVAGPCGARLVDQPVVPLGSATATAAFRSAAVAAGLPLGRVDEVKPPRPRRTGRPAVDRRRLREWRRTEPRLVVRGTPVHLVGPGGAAPADGVVVATDTPYVLGRTGAPVRVATYGDGPGAMAALVEVLLGWAPAPGRLPVEVAGVPRRGC